MSRTSPKRPRDESERPGTQQAKRPSASSMFSFASPPKPSSAPAVNKLATLLPQSPPAADDKVADMEVSILSNYDFHQQSVIDLIRQELEGLRRDLDKANVSKESKSRLNIVAAIDFYKAGKPSPLMAGYERNNGFQCLKFLANLLSIAETDSLLGKAAADFKKNLRELLKLALGNLASQRSLLLPQFEAIETELAKFAVFKERAGELDAQLQQAREQNDKLILENALLRRQVLEKATPSAVEAKDQVEKLISEASKDDGSVFSQLSKTRTHQQPAPPPPPKRGAVSEEDCKKALDTVLGFWSRPRTLILIILSGAIAGAEVPLKIKAKLDKLDPASKNKFDPMILSLTAFKTLHGGKMSGQLREDASRTLTIIIKELAEEKCNPAEVIERLGKLASIESTVASLILRGFYGDILSILNRSNLDWAEKDRLSNASDSALTKGNVREHLNKYVELYRLSKGSNFLIGNRDLEKHFKKRSNDLKTLKEQLTNPASAAQPTGR